MEREKSFRFIPSEFRKNSGRKKNSGMSSFTSVVDSELDSRHVVCKEWNVLSGISKLWSENEYSTASVTVKISLLSFLYNVRQFKTFYLLTHLKHILQRSTKNYHDLYLRKYHRFVLKSCTSDVINISEFYNCRKYRYKVKLFLYLSPLIYIIYKYALVFT
jgi:hypothetical protein